MVRRSNFKSFCMVALLVAEAIQAVTPDVASLASTRLLQIVAAITERGESLVTHRLHAGRLAIHTEKSLPPTDSVPLKDRSQESEPDEVCLASYQWGSELTVEEAGNPRKSQHGRFEFDLPSVQAGRHLSSCVSGPVPYSSTLIHSLCRMTC